MKRRRFPHPLVAVSFAAATCALVVATGSCNDEPVRYGSAHGLGTGADNGGTSSSSGSTSGGDAGADSGPQGCHPGTPDAGCPSFATDIYTPLFAAAGTYKCANGTACHGAGGTQPVMPDAPTAYTNFSTYMISNKPYVNTTCGDPGQSSITCNLLAAAACGQAMPLTPAPGIADADMNKLKAWIACGAPK